MTSIGTSRARFLLYCHNYAEYASQARNPRSAPVHRTVSKKINKPSKRQVEPKSEDDARNTDTDTFVANAEEVQSTEQTSTEIPQKPRQTAETDKDKDDKALAPVHKKKSKKINKPSKRHVEEKSEDKARNTDTDIFVANAQEKQSTEQTPTEVPHEQRQAAETVKEQTSASSSLDDKALATVYKKKRKKNKKPSKRQVEPKSEVEATNTETDTFIANAPEVQFTKQSPTEIPQKPRQTVETDKDILGSKQTGASSSLDDTALDSNADPGPSTSMSSNHIEEASKDFDYLSQLLQTIKNIGDPRIILSLHGSSDEDWQDQECLNDVLDNIVKSAGRCGFIYQSEKIAVSQKFLQTESTLERLKGVAYGYWDVNDKTKKNKATEKDNQKREKEKEAESVYNEKRLMVECYINKHMKTAIKNIEVRVPVVLLLRKGDLTELEYVARAVNVDMSVVVLKGSGGAADLISLCTEDQSNIKTASPVLLEKRLNKECENLERVMRAIIEKKWLVSVFDSKVDSYGTLWKTITNGIMRAWSFESDEDLQNDRIYRHRLLFDAQGPLFKRNVISISQHVAKQEMSCLELFGGYNLKEEEVAAKENDLYIALSSNDSTKTRRLLKRFCTVTLSMERLKSLYTEEARKNTSISFRICQRICPDECRFLTRDNSTSSKEFKSPKDAAHSIANKLLKGLWFSKIAYCKESTISAGKPSNLEDILLKHILMSNIDMARILWVESKNPITTALFSSCVLRALALKADEFFEESQDMYDHSKRFVKRAECLLDMLFQYDEDIATEALQHVDNVWGHNDSPLHFGKKFGLEDFISHSSTQKEANKRLYCYTTEKKKQQFNSTDNDTLETHDGLAPDCLSFIRHHGKRKNFWKCVTAPITKIWIQFIVFLSSLTMFSVFLLTDLNFAVVSSLEIVVFVIMVGDFLEEILNMLRCHDESRWSPQNILLHLIDIWNFMDMLCFVLYFTAFCVHLTGSEDMIIHIRRLYSVALFIMFLRILNIFLMIRKFGIIVIMIHEMLVDLVKYLVILLLFILAAGVVYHANLYPNHTIATAFPNNIGYWRIWKLLKVPYWQVYGELNLDTLEGSDQLCTNNITLWSTDPTVERCPEGDWITTVIAAFYMMLTNWLWLNTVIAMFSSRYEKVKEQAEQKWRYHRHSVVINYEHWIPSPLNFISRPIYGFYKLIKCYKEREQSTCCQRSRKHKMSRTLVHMQMQFARKIIEDEMNATPTTLHV